MLLCKSKFVNNLKSIDDIKILMRSLKSVKSVDLVVEGIFRNNNIDISILCYEDAIAKSLTDKVDPLITELLTHAKNRVIELSQNTLL